MHDPNEYTITCRRTKVDNEVVFEARVIELPDVVGYGESRAEAESEALEAIAGLQDLAKEMGHEFPAPNPVPTEYSGRITLRTSKTLHRQAATLAHLEDVSLNQFINEAIAARVTERNRTYDSVTFTLSNSGGALGTLIGGGSGYTVTGNALPGGGLIISGSGGSGSTYLVSGGGEATGISLPEVNAPLLGGNFRVADE